MSNVVKLRQMRFINSFISNQYIFAFTEALKEMFEIF